MSNLIELAVDRPKIVRPDFKKSNKEKGQLITEKKNLRKALQAKYGTEWKRFLNVTKPVHDRVTF